MISELSPSEDKKAAHLTACCRVMARMAVSIWILRHVCPECGWLYADGHGVGCALHDVGGAELPEGWSPKLA